MSKTVDELLEMYKEIKKRPNYGAGFTHWGWFKEGHRLAEQEQQAEIERLKEQDAVHWKTRNILLANIEQLLNEWRAKL